jgi:hypothetical protein
VPINNFSEKNNLFLWSKNFLMIKYTSAIIGLGRIGYSLQKDNKREQPASHSIALKNNNRIIIKAGCDIDENKLNEWHKEYKKANIYCNYIEMFKKERPDIAVIAVNEINHCKIALKSIEFKPKLIILEKPAAPDIKSALKIKSYSDKFKVPVCINHERRFSLDYQILKKMIDSQKIGTIHSVHANLWSSNPVYHKASENTGSCSLIHDGIHIIDIINYLFDFNLKYPVIDKVIKKRNIIKSIYLHYNLGNDKILYFDINGQKKYFGFEVEIRTDISRIIIGNGYFKYFETKPSKFYSGFYSLKQNMNIKRPKKTYYFSNMIKNCIDFLDGKTSLASTLNDGIFNLEIIYDIINKIKSK